MPINVEALRQKVEFANLAAQAQGDPMLEALHKKLYGGVDRASALPSDPSSEDLFGLRETADFFQGQGVNVKLPSDIAANEFATSLELRHTQAMAQRRAATETRGLMREFSRAGEAERFERYAELEGRDPEGGVIEQLGIMDQLLQSESMNTVFDALSIGAYPTAAFFQEYMKSGGTIADGLEQAGIEFRNALPGIEDPRARRPSFVDVLHDQDIRGWQAFAAGLFLDVVVDPLNIIPFVGLTKAGTALKTGAKVKAAAAKKASGPVGRGIDFLFRPRRDLWRLGETGEKADRHRQLAEAAILNDVTFYQDRIEKLVSWLRPEEADIIGLYLDKPTVMKGQLERLSDANIIDKERLPELLKRADKARVWFQHFHKLKKEAGLHDSSMMKVVYDNAVTAKDPKVIRGQQKLAETALEARRGVKATPESLDAAPSGNTTYDRFRRSIFGHSLDSKGNAIATETNIGNILLGHSVESVVDIQRKKFADAMLTDPTIATPVSKEIWSKKKKLQQHINKFAKENPGYRVWTLKKKRVNKNGSVVEDVVGAWELPAPVVEAVEKVDSIFENSLKLGNVDVTKFVQAVDSFSNFWKGWAVFGTGYVSRNYQSALLMNWKAGVGTDYVAATNDLLKKGEWQMPGQWATRHIQGLKVLSAVNRAGRPPKWMIKHGNKLAKAVGLKNFDDVKLDKINVQGKDMTIEEVAILAEEWGVPTTSTKLYNTPEGFDRLMFNSTKGKIDYSEVDPTSGIVSEGIEAIKAGRDQRSTVGELFHKTIGNDSPVLMMNRALAQTTENHARITLFIDRLMKGYSPAEAKAAVTTFHFDYRNLTDVEKTVFRPLIPFYAWQRFSLPRMVMSTLTSPGRMSKIPKAKAAIERMSQEWQDHPTPDYFDEVQAIQLPFAKDDKAMFLQLDAPILELGRVNRKDIASGLHPAIKIFYESHSGRTLFTDAPVENFPGEEAQGALGMTKAESNVLSTLFPPAGKALRVLKAQERGEGFEQMLSEFGGVKLRASDPARWLRGQTFQKQKMARDFRKILVQEGKLRP